MELRRSVKPLVPVAVWVRFPPSAPDTARALSDALAFFMNVEVGSESVYLGAWCNWQHAGLQNQVMGVRLLLLLLRRSRRVRIMVLHRSRKPAGSVL